MSLPPYAPRSLVAERLPIIFPEGTPGRNYCVRDLAAATVFAALYVGAVEGADRYLGPVHVYRMTDEQSVLTEASDRLRYVKAVLQKKEEIAGRRWYRDNTREPIRDETLRDGLVAVGAILRREDLPTTSGAPRYALKKDFAALFDPALDGLDLEAAIGAFQASHLTPGALARVKIVRSGAVANSAGVRVTFPNHETRMLAPGPSSAIAKAVIEVFAPNFLQEPVVVWLSESGNKIVVRDEAIAKSIGLDIEVDKNLPDLILIDLGPADPLIVFAEVVATDGAITPRRQDAIFALTDKAGFRRDRIIFLTAYHDRASAGFKKTVTQIGWGGFAWFASEPDNLIQFHGEGAEAKAALR